MLSALVSTSFDDVSASGRTHSLSETVFLVSLPLLGLVGPLHPTHLLFPFFFVLHSTPQDAKHPITERKGTPVGCPSAFLQTFAVLFFTKVFWKSLGDSAF